MEPTLCFRMCDTPIIYLQKTVCRCSGTGLLHTGKQNDNVCTIPCAKPVERMSNRTNTCGGTLTYSAYVRNFFYETHGHLFTYQIKYRSCETWKTDAPYQSVLVETHRTSAQSSLNRLEQCAAACLDENPTTYLIGFHDDVDECLCILSPRSASSFSPINTPTKLDNNSCDRVCSLSGDQSKASPTFKCGSKNNSDIWAIYTLNNSCPMDFIYVKELKRCIAKSRPWNFCPTPSVPYKYDGTLPWPAFKKLIERLGLNKTTVAIDISNSYVVPNSTKCPPTNTAFSSSNYWQRWSGYSFGYSPVGSLSTTYILDNGCLKESVFSSFAHRFSPRLCISRPLFSFSESSSEDYDDNDDDDDDDDNDSNRKPTYITGVNPTTQFCAQNWFDLNGRCYRISDEPKTIAEAKKTCITPPKSSTLKTPTGSQIWIVDDNENLSDEINDAPTGQLIQYEFEWQARLAFFFLDTDPDAESVETTNATPSVYYDEAAQNDDDNVTSTSHKLSEINEFMIVQPDMMNNETKDLSCILVTRVSSATGERPVILTNRTVDCSSRYHVLCESNTLVVQNFVALCSRKPLSLGLPALVSDQLTHELCLSICQELQTKLAIVHMNRCYCLKGAIPNNLNLTEDFKNYRQGSCGDLCPGSSHEKCGNQETIVTFQILDSRRTFTYARTPAEAYPDFEYDSCVRLNTFNQSAFYQFNLIGAENIHPRYCLALCEKYQQKYALLNQDRCLCTNNPLKDESPDITILRGQSCSEKCVGNYFYSCGHSTNRTIYSVYLLQPRCRHGFEVAENDMQCVYSHHSAKVENLQAAKTFCQSIGGELAKINDLIEIQDILPDSILHTRLMQQLLIFYRFKFVNDTRYYWIERTEDRPDESSVSERLLQKCATNSADERSNCIAIQYVPTKTNFSHTNERCITVSNDCFSKSAMPVCVDQRIELKPTNVLPIQEDEVTTINVDVQDDYKCGDADSKYHFIDDYCYRVSVHEVSWTDGVAECERDGAILFVPEKSVTLQHIRSLYLRQRAYSSSGSAHIGVFYDATNRSVLQYNLTDPKHNPIVPDSNAVYDLCEKTFQERYTAVLSSSNLTLSEKTRLKKQKIGCGYIDFDSATVPTIRCDEIPCTRTTTVICQRSPTIISKSITATRVYATPPESSDDTTTAMISSTTVTNGDGSDSSDGKSSTSKKKINDNSSSEPVDEDRFNSVGRDYAPIFFLLGVVGLFVVLVIANMIYNKQIPRWNIPFYRRRQRRPTDLIYSRLTTANDFDLN